MTLRPFRVDWARLYLCQNDATCANEMLEDLRALNILKRFRVGTSI
jgi:hypothetical protein